MTTRPHDALFKAAFETPQHAAGLLRGILPAALSQAIAWDTLAPQPADFIDPDLADSHSDLLFWVELEGTPTLVYVLLEHQSTNHPAMPLRMMNYLGRICDRYFRVSGLPLPLVVPVVVSHAPGGWTAAVSFGELFEPHPASVPGIAPLMPSFSLLITDLADFSDEELHRWALAAFPKLALWLLRDARDGEQLLKSFVQWAGVLDAVASAPDGRDAANQCLRYILKVCGKVKFKQFRAKIREQIPKVEDIAVTIAEELHEEGLKKGIQQGRQEGRVGLLGRQLALKFGGLPTAYAARIAAATEEELDRYAERILCAVTIEAVFAT
ncbi:Mobile element protein [Enhygromyxa salina]|uniref:Mobile element protein n=1 Tax=Enhygromyxa salina TaxID=215803 RepID=A0A0C1ZNP0_9BACT|nr:Rpn family recombination-promoting nuclease/putative transposase [Enhygromyxa salina]KIG12688.1 Mobile element protein [Enhygromyxa salina]